MKRERGENRRSGKNLCVLTLYKGVLIFSTLKDTKMSGLNPPIQILTFHGVPHCSKFIPEERVPMLTHKSSQLLSVLFSVLFRFFLFSFHSFCSPSTPFVFFSFLPNTQLRKKNVLPPSRHIVLKQNIAKI